MEKTGRHEGKRQDYETSTCNISWNKDRGDVFDCILYTVVAGLLLKLLLR